MASLLASLGSAASIGGVSQEPSSLLQDVLSNMESLSRPKPTTAPPSSGPSGSAVKYNVINEYLGGGDGYDRPKTPTPTVSPSTGGKSFQLLRVKA